MFSHKAGYKSILENLEAQTIHLQVDNMVDLQYVLNIGGIRTQNLKLVILAKEIWDHLPQCGITLTAE